MVPEGQNSDEGPLLGDRLLTSHCALTWQKGLGSSVGFLS